MEQQLISAAAKTPAALRPATPDEVNWVQQRLHEAIAQSPFYGAPFKQYERDRYSRTFLRRLIAIDPWHIAIAMHRGAAAGFVITIPEFGTLWSPWIYALPEFRRSTVALTMMRESIAHWDNGRFHKVCCYAKPENAGARKLFERFGFKELAVLKQHVLGEDLVLLERAFRKVTPDYDNGVSIGRLGRLRLRLEHLRGHALGHAG